MSYTKRIIEPNEKHGMLTFVEEAEREPGKKKRRRITCKCDCGAAWTGRLENWINGNTVSCGCAEVAAKTKHSQSRTKTYRVWSSMLNRCKNHKNYGGRGIGVCERWRNFENFINDMGYPQFPGAEIDRKNNDGDYEPGNCTWSTHRSNNCNKRGSFIWTIDGVEYESSTLAASALGVHSSTVAWWCNGNKAGCSKRRRYEKWA